ncbi:MAG: hypothetical protein NTW28_16035 [Candidatus Solibacter sp.]|nr:hypothetical protein [Candidatus Solibacter sp.]
MWILAGKRKVKLNFGRRDDRVLPILRRVLRESWVGARARRAAVAGQVQDAPAGQDSATPVWSPGDHDALWCPGLPL